MLCFSAHVDDLDLQIQADNKLELASKVTEVVQGINEELRNLKMPLNTDQDVIMATNISTPQFIAEQAALEFGPCGKCQRSSARN